MKNIFLAITIVVLVNLPLIGNTNYPDKVIIKQYKSKYYVSLYDFSKFSGVDYHFDVVTQRGSVFYKGHKAVFQPGLSVVLTDGYLYSSSYPVVRVKGEVLIPVASFYGILSHFYKGAVYVQGSKAFVKKSISNEKELPKIKHIKEKIRFIVIDAGHGGKDPGALGAGGYYEKTITLAVSNYIADYLQKNLKGVRVVRTRKTDKFIELGKRTEIANKLLTKGSNGLFISIHVNASLSSKASGYETYFLSQNASNDEARATAALENNVVVLENKTHSAGDDPDYVEALMLTTQIQNESKMLSESIQTKLKKKLSKSGSRGVKKSDFFVLRGVLMPATLVEIGYITNKTDLKNLKKTSYRKKVAEAVGMGVIDFINEYNKEK